MTKDVTTTNLTLQRTARQSRRAAIEAFFREHLGQRFSTSVLHERFGSAFRTRVSEINRDTASPVRILNASSTGRNASGQPCERSEYWAELRDRGREAGGEPLPNSPDWYERQTGKPRPSGKPPDQPSDPPLFAESQR